MNYVRNNKSQDSRILGFFILYFHQSMKSRHPRVVASPAMSSIVPCTLFLKMEQAKKSFSLELLFTLSPTQQLRTNIQLPSGAANRQLQVARGSQQVVQDDTKGGEDEVTRSFLILLFLCS